MRQKLFAHGPGAMTSCSPTSIRPWSVSTAVTASSGPSSSPVTSTPVRISTPWPRAFAASPSTESWLNAKPPWDSCRQAVTPCARQSGKSSFMWRSTSASPVTKVERYPIRSWRSNVSARSGSCTGGPSAM